MAAREELSRLRIKNERVSPSFASAVLYFMKLSATLRNSRYLRRGCNSQLFDVLQTGPALRRSLLEVWGSPFQLCRTDVVLSCIRLFVDGTIFLKTIFSCHISFFSCEIYEKYMHYFGLNYFNYFM